MRKKIILIIISMVLITGCSKTKSGTCTIDLTNTELNYTLNSVYKIYYNDKYVTKIEKEDTYKSGDFYILNYFNEYKSLEYDNLNDLYGGYKFDIIKGEDKIRINVTINMDKLNLTKMVKDGYIDKDYVISNRLTKSGIKEIYESRGASCGI